jgi:hypothetical protein
MIVCKAINFNFKTKCRKCKTRTLSSCFATRIDTKTEFPECDFCENKYNCAIELMIIDRLDRNTLGVV